MSLPTGHVRDEALGSVTFGVRPEHLTVASEAEADFRGPVEIVEKLGAESLVCLQTEFSADPVSIRVSPERQVGPGDKLSIRVERERFHLFEASGTVL